MDFNLFEKLLFTAKSWNTKEITFLGGEPTMYPRFKEALELTHKANYRARIVTNGHASYASFLDSLKEAPLPFVCFSIDGSRSLVHDAIRGNGSFRALCDNVSRSSDQGIRMAGIVSLSRQNVDDLEAILRLCDSFNFEYVNIHYVTYRGFGKPEIVLSIQEWKQAYARIVSLSKSITTELRVEKTFFSNRRSEEHTSELQSRFGIS